MADPPVVRRLRIVMNQLTRFTTQHGKSTDKYSRYAWVLQAMFDEILDELAENGEVDDKLASWFEQFGTIIEWCGSGDESVLPPSVRAYLMSEFPQEMLAITSGGE